MTKLHLGPHDELYYEYQAPSLETGGTLVFFNALTGDTATWEAVIGPRVRNAGHGTLAFDFRGQTMSAFSPDLVLDADLVVADACRLLEKVNPIRPILVGLSIGGLFATRAWLNGSRATGLVLINALRRDGPRLKWIGDALVRAVETGGLDLFRDLFLPLLMNEDWIETNRSNFLKPESVYEPLVSNSGPYKLLAEAGRTADWDIPYESLDLPTLVITGLQDHVFLERDVVDELSNRLPQSRRIDMPDAGHLIPAERPEALADFLIEFASEVV